MEDVSAASLALHEQNFVNAAEKNIVRKFASRLSFTLHKISKYKGFLRAKFPVYGQNPRTYTGKHVPEKRVSEKTRIFAYFTECDAFHLLTQKRTHY